MSPLELRFGYAVTAAAQLDVLVEYRPRFAFKGRANFLSPESRQSVAADLSSFAGMVAADINLPGLGVPSLGPLVPFVGAGLGVVRTRIGQTRMTFPATTTIVPGASRTGAVWMVTARLAAPLGERVTLGLAWRYTDLGAVHTGHGAGRGDLAGWTTRTATARSCRDAGEALGPRSPAVPALWVLRRRHGGCWAIGEAGKERIGMPSPNEADHGHKVETGRLPCDDGRVGIWRPVVR